MKFYSEELKKLFDSEEELRKAEKAHRVEHNKKMKIMNEIETHFTAACDEFDIVFKKLEEVNDIMTDEEATSLFKKLLAKIPSFMSSFSFII